MRAATHSAAARTEGNNRPATPSFPRVTKARTRDRALACAQKRDARTKYPRKASAFRGIWRRLHGRAGQREGPRLRLRLACLLVRRRGLRSRLRRLLREDRLLGLSGEQPLELLLVDRLALDQDRGYAVQLVHVLAEHLRGRVVRLFDDASDLVVDLARDLFGIVRLGAHVAAEEGLVVATAEHARPELLAHAVAHDHLLRCVRDLFQVVRGARRDLAEHELLRCATTERHREIRHQVRLRREVAVLARQRDRVAERLTAPDDRDLVHFRFLVEEVPDDRVPELVVGGDSPLLFGEEAGLLLGTGHHAHDPFFELFLLDRLLSTARGEQRRLVHKVGEIGAGEAGRSRRERVEVDLGREWLPFRVHLEDLPAAVSVGTVDHDLPVETPGTQQGGIEDVGTVRRRDQDDVVLQLESVHLDEQLIQRLLTLVVAAAETGTAVTADGIDLVHEHDARRCLLRLLEQVAHTRSADADEHLDEIGARDREERHAGLAGDRPREQRLAGTRRAVEEDALRDPRAERLELLRVLEELLDLLELLDRLVDAGDVLEADLRRVGRHPLRARLAERHHLRAAALHLVHQEDPEPEQEDEREQRREDRPPRRRARPLRVELDVLLLEQVLERVLRLVARVVDGRRLAGVRPGRELHLDRPLVRVEGHAADTLVTAVPDLLDHLRVRQVLALAAVPAERLQRQPDQRRDDHEREEGAAEETIHLNLYRQGSSVGLSSIPRQWGFTPSLVASLRQRRAQPEGSQAPLQGRRQMS